MISRSRKNEKSSPPPPPERASQGGGQLILDLGRANSPSDQNFFLENR